MKVINHTVVKGAAPRQVEEEQEEEEGVDTDEEVYGLSLYIYSSSLHSDSLSHP